MSDADVKRWIIVCATVEGAAWGAAWLLDWPTPALVVAVTVTVGVAGVIFELKRRRQARKGGE